MKRLLIVLGVIAMIAMIVNTEAMARMGDTHPCRGCTIYNPVPATFDMPAERAADLG